MIVLNGIPARGSETRDDRLSPLTPERRETIRRADSIMRIVIRKATEYENTVSEYDARIYTKGRTEILRQNILIRLAPHIIPVDWKNKDMLFEMVSQSTYTSPNHYTHNLEAVNGNSIPDGKKQEEVLAFLNLNVYSPTVYNDAIFMPIAENAFDHYAFNLESSEEVQGYTIYKISFLPKQWSQKLACGYLYIVDQVWSIDRIDINGRYSFAEFNLAMSYGRDSSQFILPTQADLFLRYKVLGNTIVSTYHSSFQYQRVKRIETASARHSRRASLDLTSYAQISADTIPIVKDPAFWAEHRDLPLMPEEEALYQMVGAKEGKGTDTTENNLRRYVKLTKQLTNTVNMDFKSTRIKYSGLLNPFQLGYSARNGITYKQAFRVRKLFDRDRQIRFNPEVGYVFKRKQLFFKIRGEWEYLPQRMGTLSLEVANDNESYSSEITDRINEELRDSTFNFEDLDLEYFKHYYAELKNDIELSNGFLLTTGISYHRRIPTKRQAAINPGEDVTEILNQEYNDFVPAIGISYTPRQYYRMDGYKKEYVYSYYPTLSIEFAKAIPGIGESTGDYARIEADIHQSLMLGLCRRLNYHVSGGLYTRQRSTYFADFKYFARRNFPETWDDQIGGVFNLLKGEWYNASDKYVQAHLMYESPFVLFKILRINSKRKFLRMVSRYILSERFYLSQLWTPMLPSYTEIGYGIGNHLFNIAAFASFDRWEYQGMGFKFAFELFQ